MKLNYRPEIDGLRAIAVMAVIIYHANIVLFGHSLLSGGFIGVDIFFVISGYLITSIIIKELYKNDTISFSYFYERRIRRLLPALLFVMIISFPFAWYLLLQRGFIDYSKSILASLTFISNFYFYITGQIYGAEDGLLKPFLHTWSLSIEEQYYIIFPIFMFFIYKFLRKYIFFLLPFIFVISFIFASYKSNSNPSYSFYMLNTRGWELIFGSILAYLEINYGRPKKNKAIYNILVFIGLITLIFSLFAFKDTMYHPSYMTLIPITGMGLIIWFSNTSQPITKLLSTKLFVGIGLISYSLYLWHYPIFSFSRIVNFTEGDILKKILLAIIIFFLALITYIYIERPARNKKFKFKFIIIYIFSSLVIIIFSNILVIKNDGFKLRLPKMLSDNFYERPETLLKNMKGESCHDNIKGCLFNELSKKKVYIIGDSHMASLMYDLKDKLLIKDYQFITSVFSQCIFFPDFNKVTKKNNKIDKNCNDKYFKRLKEKLINEKDAIIIFGGRWPVYFNKKYFDNQEGGIEHGEWESEFIPTGRHSNIQESFKENVTKIAKNNKIIIVYPIPEVGIDVPRAIYSKWLEKKFQPNYLSEKISTSYLVYKQRNSSSFDFLNSFDNSNIYRVFPHELFCNKDGNNRCLTHDNNNKFYCDNNHPSIKGAEMINSLIVNKIELIENE